MEIRTSHSGDNGRVEISGGDIDERGAEMLKARLQEMAHLKEIDIDFGDVRYIGSSGIGKLLLFYKNVSVHGGNIRISNLSPDMRNLFMELKLDSIFELS